VADRVKCRFRRVFDVRFLPCNWDVAGFCGVDACLCKVECA